MKHVELPRELRDALQSLSRGTPVNQLNPAVTGLSARYRAPATAGEPVAQSREDVLAYAAYRFPATYAAIVSALEALREQREGWSPRSLLDLGAGSGAGIWATVNVWPGIEKVRAIDAEPEMIAAGRTMSSTATHPAPRLAEWVRSDLRQADLGGPYDLVLIAYVLGELDPAHVTAILDRAWRATGEALVIVEPGTPAGAERLREARNRLAAQNAHTLAPCPHDRSWQGYAGDWMHFAVRLPRTRLHRAAKASDLAYEDEKFSYVVLSRTPGARQYSRIIRHPQVRKGHVSLELCTADGVKTVVISRRDGDLYSRARKASWGDVFDLPG